MTKLEKYFHLYNKKYFDGQLPTPVLRWADLNRRCFGHCWKQDIDTVDVDTDEVVSTRSEHVIELGAWCKDNNTIWRWTLLHEMVHISLWDRKCKDHGRLFNKEMRRLANAGAFDGLW